VARYAADHKQATRQRILETAGRRFKQDGIDGSGIATLMKDAGLTNGAFYAHFSSKDDLVAAVIAAQLDEQTTAFAARAAEPGGLERIVREYLSLAHRDDRGDGCPSAALLDEIDRAGEPVRQAYTDGLLRLVDGLAAHVAPDDPVPARASVLGVVALLTGTLQLARALTDPDLVEDLLHRSARTAITMLAAGA
jgi:TetR/AcrR family transcriptional regulator, transcriptional repressor for nem operon